MFFQIRKAKNNSLLALVGKFLLTQNKQIHIENTEISFL